MKILHISGAKGWGGNEQQIISLLPKLKNYEIDNLVFGFSNSVLEKECNLYNIDFSALDSKKLNSFKSYKKLNEVIKSFKPNIVQLHTSDSLMFYLFANFIYKFNVKLIFSKKGIGGSSSQLSKLKYNSNSLSAIFCVSKSVESSFAKILNKKTKAKTIVINDCVPQSILKSQSALNLRSHFAISEGIKLVGNIANHTSAKDLFTLVDVLHYIVHVQKRDDIYFIQIGEFSKRTDAIKAYATKRGVLKQLVFLDKYPNAALLNPQFDCFLLTSEREGGPTSVLEAMLFNTAVVSTKVGLIEDVIIDAENGFTANVKDAENLAKGVIKLVDNKELQEKFTSINKEIISEKFTAEKIALKTKEAYQKVYNS